MGLSIEINEKKTQKELAKYVATRMASAIRPEVIEASFRKYFELHLSRHPSWNSLNGGKLAADFGLVEGTEQASLDGIRGVWLRSIKARPKKAVAKLRSGQVYTIELQIAGVDSTYEDVTNLTEAITNNNGQRLPWLKWLLTFGDSLIIPDYEVAYGNYPDSRSGVAVMVVSIGEGFSVDPAHSGRPGDNMITDVVKSMVSDTALIREVEAEILQSTKAVN